MKKCSGCGQYFDDKYDVCPSCGRICPVVNVIDLTKVKRYHNNTTRRQKIIILCAVIFIVAVIAAFCVVMHGRKNEKKVITESVNTVKMPELKGLTYDEAYALCRMQLLYVEINGVKEDSDTEDGLIATQSEDTGSVINAGSVIYVTVSRKSAGTNGKTVPDVRYMSAGQAQEVLEECGLRADIVYEFSDSVSKGCVTAQMPAAGEACGRNDKITMTVSGDGE